MYTNCEFYVLSWSSALACDCAVEDSKFQILKLGHEQIRDWRVKQEAMKVMAKYLAWNFEVLAAGVVPNRGFYGEELQTKEGLLMDGWTACCTGWKGDLKARKEAHFFQQHYQSTFLCERCYATQAFPNVMKSAWKRALLFTNFGPNALRHRFRVQHVNYMASAAEKSPWLVHVPGLHLTTIFFDMMHVAHLGILRNLVAAMCLDFADREAIALPELWVEFKVWCKDRSLGPHEARC